MGRNGYLRERSRHGLIKLLLIGEPCFQIGVVPGLRELADRVGVPGGASAPVVAAAIDFVLEGLCAQKKISRSEEGAYSAGTDVPRRSTRREEQGFDEEIRLPSGGKKKYYN